MEILFDRIEGEDVQDFMMSPCETCGTTPGVSGPSPGCHDMDGCGMFLDGNEELD